MFLRRMAAVKSMSLDNYIFIQAFLYPFMSIDHRGVQFYKEDKVRFTRQAVQTVFLPSGLREFLRERRQLTVATGFAVACVTRVTGTSKRTCGIRARS